MTRQDRYRGAILGLAAGCGRVSGPTTRRWRCAWPRASSSAAASIRSTSCGATCAGIGRGFTAAPAGVRHRHDRSRGAAEAALWAFAESSTFEDGALLAVNLGDDADTTGAIYGQLAAAFYGVEGIPHHWREMLAARGTLERLADGLLREGG